MTRDAEPGPATLVPAMLNGTGVLLCLSIGHRTGLLDEMSVSEPVTSRELASRCNLSERYVREWLHVLCAGALVRVLPDERFELKSEWLPYVTRAGGASNAALHAQYLAVLAAVEDEVVDAFREGGGVAYSRYRNYQAVRAEKGNATFDAVLLDRLIPAIDGLDERLTAGLDVLDVGCGEGHAVNLMAERYPRSRFVGVDLSSEGIEAARREADRLRLDNVTFEAVDARSITGGFDLITIFDVLHDLADPDAVLAGLRSALREDGVVVCAEVAASGGLADDINHPYAAWMYTLSLMHCMTVSLAQGGPGHGTMWGRPNVRSALDDAGLEVVAERSIEGDALNVYFVARPSDRPGS